MNNHLISILIYLKLWFITQHVYGQFLPTNTHSSEYIKGTVLLLNFELPVYLFVHFKVDDSIIPVAIPSDRLIEGVFYEITSKANYLKILHEILETEHRVIDLESHNKLQNLEIERYSVDRADYLNIHDNYTLEYMLSQYTNEHGVFTNSTLINYQSMAVLAYFIDKNCRIQIASMFGHISVSCN